jgi:hypothetical protein
MTNPAPDSRLGLTVAQLERRAMWWERVTDAVDTAEVATGGPASLETIEEALWGAAKHDTPPPPSATQIAALLVELHTAGLVVYVDGSLQCWRLA